jgi:hypothetical protein
VILDWRSVANAHFYRRNVHWPSMRRPVDVKRDCGWVSSYLMFFFARISGNVWLARRPSRPSASEFIWSLDGRRSRP